MRRTWTVLAPIAIAALANKALAQGTLRIDIPLITGHSDNGGEGMRFIGYRIYDGPGELGLELRRQDVRHRTGACDNVVVDAADKTRWTLRIRDGVIFHEGSTFTAQSVVWKLEKLIDDKSPQFDPRQTPC
jgi:peptide/nickel transport system substrate-binding protein